MGLRTPGRMLVSVASRSLAPPQRSVGHATLNTSYTMLSPSKTESRPDEPSGP